MQYAPLPSQQLFHDLPDRFKGFSGPVGSGKTQALCHEALKLAYVNKGLPGIIGAPTFPMLRDVTRLMFLETLEVNGVPYRYNKADNEVILAEVESTVRFRSLEVFEKLRGSNIAWFGVDELTYCKPGAWQRLEARCRLKKAPHLCGFAAWTPNGFDATYERFISDEKIEGYKAIVARPYENIYLDEQFYKGLERSYDDRFFQQEVLGEYLDLFTGKAYYAFSEANKTTAAVYDPHLPIRLCCDFNIDPMAWLIAQQDGQGVITVLRELFLRDCNTLMACEELGRILTDMHVAHDARIHVYADATGRNRAASAHKSSLDQIYGYLKEQGWRSEFHVQKSNPSIKDRIEAVNVKLRQSTAGVGLFVDSKRCRELIKDFHQVGWAVDSHGNPMGYLSTKDPMRNHLSDALGYYIFKEFGIGSRAITTGTEAIF